MRQEGEGFEKMVAKELAVLNKNIILHRKNLKELLAEKNPSIAVKGQEDYVFDKAALKKAAAKYPEHKHDDVKLPVLFYIDTEVPNQCYIREELNADFFKKISGLEGYKYKKGKMWLSKAVASDLMREYPTLFQYFFLP